MERVLESEWLDELAPDDRAAVSSRRDLRRLNRVMGNIGVLGNLLKTGLRGARPRRIVELGAGDGTLMLRLAQELASEWKGVEVTLVDRKDAVTDATRARFEGLGWDLKIETADVFDWLAKPGETADAIVANLFLHHFSRAQLGELLRFAALRTRVVAASEPRRGWLPLWFSRMVGVIGCNAVTRHDAVISVRAGFADRELSTLWPATTGWRLQEHAAGLFTHAFLAERIPEI